MAIYLNYNNLGIKGDVTQGNHKDWIALNSFQWGVGRGISSPVGNLKNREASEPSVSEITVTKQLDKRVHHCYVRTISSTKKGCYVIDFVRTGEKGDDVYLKFTLTNALISGYSLSLRRRQA